MEKLVAEDEVEWLVDGCKLWTGGRGRTRIGNDDDVDADVEGVNGEALGDEEGMFAGLVASARGEEIDAEEEEEDGDEAGAAIVVVVVVVARC